MNETWAIILSAGKGTRMKTDICKQYIPVEDKPVLFYTLKAFEQSEVDNIVIVAGENDVDYVNKEIVKKYGIEKLRHIVKGGLERYDSVISGLNEIDADGKVLIHDGARPLIEVNDINKIISELDNCEACVAAMPVKDTIKIADEKGFVKETPDRNIVWQVQTPQAFSIRLIKEAYLEMQKHSGTGITDDAMVVEKYTKSAVKLMETSYSNIKITTIEDLDFMKQILIKKQKNKQIERI